MVVTKAELSRILNISRNSITKACKAGNLQDVDGKIDTQNPENKIYLETHGFDFSSGYTPKPEKKQPKVKTKKQITAPQSTIEQANEDDDETDEQNETLDPNDKETQVLQGMSIEDLYNDSLFRGAALSLLEKREKILTTRARRQKLEIENEIKRATLIDKKFIDYAVSLVDQIGQRIFDYAEASPELIVASCLSEKTKQQKPPKRHFQGSGCHPGQIKKRIGYQR
jgi:hypothetical protein